MSRPENTLKERIAPGIWIDANGDPHWSIPELLALVDLPDTPENRAAVTEILSQAIRQARPTLTIVHRPEPDRTQ